MPWWSDPRRLTVHHQVFMSNGQNVNETYLGTTRTSIRNQNYGFIYRMNCTWMGEIYKAKTMFNSKMETVSRPWCWRSVWMQRILHGWKNLHLHCRASLTRRMEPTNWVSLACHWHPETVLWWRELLRRLKGYTNPWRTLDWSGNDYRDGSN